MHVQQHASYVSSAADQYSWARLYSTLPWSSDFFFDPCAIFGNKMFNTIRVAHSFMKLSYVGGEGVEGGQGEL
jgi:hypothetical protein